LNRFFTLNQEKQQFQVHKNIREIILFSVQNIIKDPPYSKIDLISCRNILIYLNTDLHKKLIPLLHYSLNENGILFLGTSESIGEFTDLFHPLVRNSKVYQRKGKPSPQKPIASVLSSPENQVYYPADKPMNIEQKKISLKDLAEAELLTRYAPAAVIINADGEAVYFHGRTGKYLEPAPGVAGTKLVRMARPGLQNELENAIFRATISKKETIYPNLKVKTNGTYTLINLTVKALELSPEWKMQTDTHLYIVIFEEVPIAFPEAVEKLTGKESIKKNSDLINKIANLEQELRSKDTYLQSTLEEMETSTEEMKSTNEEMQSMNEELQSTNEELETSREELQSVNEELTTVNSELHVKIQNLSKAEDDFNNLLGSTGIGTIFVNLQQLIQRYTPSVTKIIKLIKSDVGRHVGDIVTNLINYDTLTEDIQTVLDTLVPLERDVQSKNDAWYLLRIVPYRTLENVIDGAVITFVDITLHKTADKVLQEYEALKRLTAVVRDASDAVIMQDLNGKILAWNPAAEKMYGYSEAEALVMNTYDIIPASLKKSTHSIYNNLNSMPLNPFNSRRICQDGKIMPVLVTATALINDKGDVYAIATTEKSKSV
jgi:two-component system CheB/CheR fusion protein